MAVADFRAITQYNGQVVYDVVAILVDHDVVSHLAVQQVTDFRDQCQFAVGFLCLVLIAVGSHR